VFRVLEGAATYAGESRQSLNFHGIVPSLGSPVGVPAALGVFSQTVRVECSEISAGQSWCEGG
jgi:hypothetical protein